MTLDDAALVRARDGLVARATGPWAAEKLQPLEHYLGMMSTAMRGKFPNGIVFVDLMAGPGLCVDTRTSGLPELKGSTLRALGTPFAFSRIIAVESEPNSAAALRQRVSDHFRGSLCDIREGDCNDTATVAAIRAATDRALTLMFVDLIGTEVQMATIRALTHDRTVDLLFTWPEMDATRNRGMLLEQRDRWTAFLGSDEWERDARSRGPHWMLRTIQRLYVKQLEGLGYQTRFMPAIRNQRGGALYRPLFASRHSLGLKFWAVSSRRPQQGLAFED